jgi:hypothetical protein
MAVNVSRRSVLSAGAIGTAPVVEGRIRTPCGRRQGFVTPSDAVRADFAGPIARGSQSFAFKFKGSPPTDISRDGLKKGLSQGKRESFRGG